jgi:hypothetical protein
MGTAVYLIKWATPREEVIFSPVCRYDFLILIKFGFILMQCRVNPMTLGCIAGSLLLRRAASLAFEKNKRSTVTTDIIEFLGKRFGSALRFEELFFSSSFSCACLLPCSLEDICPAEY